MAVNRFQNPNPKTEQKSFSERDQLTDEAAREEIELNQHSKLTHTYGYYRMAKRPRRLRENENPHRGRRTC